MTTRKRSKKSTARAGDKVLTRLVEELKRHHQCHTVILYGSRARGSYLRASDYDLVGICRNGPVRHFARRLGRAYLDAFVYPERQATPKELLRIRGGTVLCQRHDFGDALLHRIDRYHARGPKPLTSDEITLRRLWAQKMLDRAKRADAEGHFRRAWLLNALLEDYFALRGLWYEGPKRSLEWLRDRDPETAFLFAKALEPGARLAQIAKLATTVTTLRI